MKFFLATLLVAIMVALAMAASDLKSIIVSYPEGAPTSELDELKKAIDEAGGIVTHEYNPKFLGKMRCKVGLAAKVPKDFEQTIRTMGEDHNVVVEEDKVVSINDSPPS